jgi:hypothetical protein
MRLNKILLLFLGGILLLTGCKKFDDKLNGLLTNPSVPTPEAADADLYLNNLQLGFQSFYQAASDLTDPLVRQETMFGPLYYNAYSPTSFDGIWTTAYTTVFKTANTMIPLAEDKQEYVHSGIAKVLKAYTMITMVDLFGDVPYSEANLGVVNTNPAVDPGANIYDSALALLDDAITTLGKTSLATPANDLFYGNSGNEAGSWITLAKTLKLKAYVQRRLVDANAAAEIGALLSDGDLITSSSQDFVYSFSTHNTAPDSRAPHYVSNYGTDIGTSDYLGNYFMWCLAVEKGIVDPRTRYYVYRQIDDIDGPPNSNYVYDYSDPRLPDQTTTQFALACYYRNPPTQYAPGTPYCIVANGYWGRDHGNNEGTGPDAQLKSTWGLYPVGGVFDADQNDQVGPSHEAGAKGNGINPIWLSSYTYFLESEAALMLQTAGDPEALLTSGVNASFSKVANFATSLGYTLPSNADTTMTITAYNQQNYVNKVKSLYESAATTADKLNVIMKEYYLASWGNGIEPYNNYRRTSMPNNLQPAVNPDPGNFLQSFFYASVYANYNKNAVQKKTADIKVFWDTNPDALK